MNSQVFLKPLASCTHQMTIERAFSGDKDAINTIRSIVSRKIKERSKSRSATDVLTSASKVEAILNMILETQNSKFAVFLLENSINLALTINDNEKLMLQNIRNSFDA